MVFENKIDSIIIINTIINTPHDSLSSGQEGIKMKMLTYQQ